MTQLSIYPRFAYIGPAESKEEAWSRLFQPHRRVAVDTETISLKGDKSVPFEEEDDEGNLVTEKRKVDGRTMIGIGIATSANEAWYFPLGNGAWANVPQGSITPLIEFLSNPSMCKWYWNAMFDLDRIEENSSINIDDNFHDVAAASNVQGLHASLDAACGWYLGVDHVAIGDILPKGKTMLDLPYEQTARKCMNDCMDTLKLGELFKIDEWDKYLPLTWTDYLGQIHDVPATIQDCYQVDKHCIPLLRKMSRQGIAIRPDKVKAWYEKLQRQIQQYDDWFKPFGINPQSNDQVGWFLNRERGHWIAFTETKKHFHVTEEVLRSIAVRDPVAYMVLARRHRQKLKGTYIDPHIIFDGHKRHGRILDFKDRAYAHFRLDLATGRLASYDINIQNQPDLMREIYKAENPSGKWSWMDLHQAEMRVWAAQAQDEVMLEAFRQGSSPHETTLAKLFPGIPKRLPSGLGSPEYTDSKSFNFALLFDASAETLARTTKRPISVCAAYQSELFELYWKSKLYIAERRADTRPYASTDYGRRCKIPDGPRVTREHQEKCRINYPTQGSVADAIKRIMLGLDAQGYDFPAQVHDEILDDAEKYQEDWPLWIQDVHPAVSMPFEVTCSEVWV